MDKIFIAGAFLAIIGVVISLCGGLIAMARGTPKDNKISQRMMQLRVTCQAIALICLFLAFLSH